MILPSVLWIQPKEPQEQGVKGGQGSAVPNLLRSLALVQQSRISYWFLKAISLLKCFVFVFFSKALQRLSKGREISESIL